MKKVLFIFAVAFTALSFTSCGNSSKKVETNEEVVETIVEVVDSTATEVVEVVDSTATEVVEETVE